MILFFNEDVTLPFKGKRGAKQRIKTLIETENKKAGDINYIFCSDSYLLTINKEYLNHDYYTDVITFDYVNGDTISGDIFISVDRIKENADTYHINFNNELSRVMYHGVLHLCGYKDKTPEEEKVMRAKENYYLDILSIIE